MIGPTGTADAVELPLVLIAVTRSPTIAPKSASVRK
jgi:hypothetical protein